MNQLSESHAFMNDDAAQNVAAEKLKTEKGIETTITREQKVRGPRSPPKAPGRHYVGDGQTAPPLFLSSRRNLRSGRGGAYLLLAQDWQRPLRGLPPTYCGLAKRVGL